LLIGMQVPRWWATTRDSSPTRAQEGTKTDSPGGEPRTGETSNTQPRSSPEGTVGHVNGHTAKGRATKLGHFLGAKKKNS